METEQQNKSRRDRGGGQDIDADQDLFQTAVFVVQLHGNSVRLQAKNVNSKRENLPPGIKQMGHFT